ncbi:MAG TPA: helix-turn-helix transcriptional regulator [Tepidisphaeraceae bacterium]|jgi:transcriptional regulator with XRE-family HTH domain
MSLDYEKIKLLRERLKLTQQEAADAAGLGTRQRWNEIEAGRRTNIELATLDRIAAALRVKAKDLLK